MSKKNKNTINKDIQIIKLMKTEDKIIVDKIIYIIYLLIK